MDHQARQVGVRNRGGYLNGVLTAIAVLLGFLALDRHPNSPVPGVALGLWPGPVEAQAQPVVVDDEPVSTGLVSAGEQRKQMISELKRQSAKLDAIEARLRAGINVKVTDMPPIRLPGGNGQGEAGDKGAPGPDKK